MENKQTTNKKKSRYEDGWHTIRGYYVLVENGRSGGYDLCSGISVNTFRRHPDKYFMF